MSIKISVSQSGKAIGKPKSLKDEGKKGFSPLDHKNGRAAVAAMTKGMQDKSQVKVTVDDGANKKTYSYAEFQKLTGGSDSSKGPNGATTMTVFLSPEASAEKMFTGEKQGSVGAGARGGVRIEKDAMTVDIYALARGRATIGGGETSRDLTAQEVAETVQHPQIGTGSGGNIQGGRETRTTPSIWEVGGGTQITHRIGDGPVHLGGRVDIFAGILPRRTTNTVDLAGSQTYTQEHAGNDGCVVNCGAPQPPLDNSAAFPNQVKTEAEKSTDAAFGVHAGPVVAVDIMENGVMQATGGMGVAARTNGGGVGMYGDVGLTFKLPGTTTVIAKAQGPGRLKDKKVPYAGGSVAIVNAPAGGWPKGTYVTRNGEKIKVKLTDPLVIDTTGWKPGTYLIEVHVPGYEDPYAAVRLTVPEVKKVDSSGKGLAGRWKIMNETVTEGAREVKIDKLVPNRDIKKGTPVRLFINGDEEVTTFYVNGKVVKDGKLPMDVKKGGKIYFAVDHKAIKDSVDPETKNTLHIEFAGDKWAHKISTEPDKIVDVDLQPVRSAGKVGGQIQPTAVILKPQKGKFPKGTKITFTQMGNNWKGEPTKPRGQAWTVTLDKAMAQFEYCFGGAGQTCSGIKTNTAAKSGDGKKVNSDTIMIKIVTPNGETIDKIWNPGQKKTWSGTPKPTGGRRRRPTKQ